MVCGANIRLQRDESRFWWSRHSGEQGHHLSGKIDFGLSVTSGRMERRMIESNYR